jgi:hypothetical protein
MNDKASLTSKQRISDLDLQACRSWLVARGDSLARSRDMILMVDELLERRAVETTPPLGQEPWRCSLPVITVQMLADFGQEGFFEKTDQPVHGVAGVSWSQAAVDFSCLIQGLRKDRPAVEPIRRHSRDCACTSCHYSKKFPQVKPHHATCGCFECAPEKASGEQT